MATVTDRNSMVTEVRDPKVPTNQPLPSEPTTTDTANSPLSTPMSGDMASAYEHLKKIIAYAQSREAPNEEIIREARSIRDHYIKTKLITQSQYEWMAALDLPEDSQPLPPPHGQPPPEPVDDPEGDAQRAKDLAIQRQKEIFARNKEAPMPNMSPSLQPTIVKNLEAQVTPDPTPSGEDPVDNDEEDPIVSED